MTTTLVAVLRLLLGSVIVACAVIVLMRTKPLGQRSSRASFTGFGLCRWTWTCCAIR